MRGLPVVFLAAIGCGSSNPGDDGDDTVAPPEAATGTPDAEMQASCAGRTPQPLDQTWMLDAGGMTRTVLVHIPATVDPMQPTPVVLNFHGLTMNAGWQADMTRMIAKSDAAGFIAVHADGTGTPRGFNAGDCCDPAASSGVDEIALVGAILDELEATTCLDRDRVYSTGFSNGGFLSHRLGCELSDRIAAIAPVSGVMGMDACAPTRAVPVMQIHGTDDLLVAYDGGGLSGFRSVADTIADWAARNGCPPGAPAQTFQQGDATCLTQEGCTDGADVT